jgi:hypothetical protein
MTVFSLIAAALAVASLVYLVVALVKPELGPRPRGSARREASGREGRGF